MMKIIVNRLLLTVLYCKLPTNGSLQTFPHEVRLGFKLRFLRWEVSVTTAPLWPSEDGILHGLSEQHLV